MMLVSVSLGLGKADLIARERVLLCTVIQALFYLHYRETAPLALGPWPLGPCLGN